MTESEKVDIKDYIDARVTPLEQGQSRIELKVDALFSKLDGARSVDDRHEGAAAMKATIWKAAAAVAGFVVAAGGLAAAFIH